MPRRAVHIPPFGVDIAIFGISFTLRSPSCSRHRPRNPRGSDRHHSACITLSCFSLALPLPSTPTSFLLSFARFITNHIPLLSGRYLPRHPTSRAYNLAKHLNFISIPLLLSTSLTPFTAFLSLGWSPCTYCRLPLYFWILLPQFFDPARASTPLIIRQFLVLITTMVMAMNVTVPIEEPEWNSKPAWKLPGWAEPIVRRVSHCRENFRLSSIANA